MIGNILQMEKQKHEGGIGNWNLNAKPLRVNCYAKLPDQTVYCEVHDYLIFTRVTGLKFWYIALIVSRIDAAQIINQFPRFRSSAWKIAEAVCELVELVIVTVRG